MYTVCPQCNAVYPLATGRKKRKSSVFCKACDKKFKVTEVLAEHPLGLVAEAKAEVVVKTHPVEKSGSVKRKKPLKAEDIPPVTSVFGILHHDETVSREQAVPAIEERLPWEQEKPPTAKIWLYGSALAGLLLIGQLVYFEWENWSQDRLYRPHLERLCRTLGCNLPVYRNLAEFEVNQGGLTANSGNTLSFKAVISNHAGYPQQYPDIKLKFSDYNDTVFAERIFTSQEYLPKKGRIPETIPPGETIAIQMELLKPVMPIGAYTFDLIWQ
jgi:hypothetical protein